MKHSSLITVISFVLVPIVTASLVVGYVMYLRHQDRSGLLNQFNETIAPHADAIMTDDAVLENYVQTYGPAPTMRVLIAAANKAGIDCHDRAHRFGRVSYEEFGDEVLKLNLPECHSGFYHGAIEEYFKVNGTDHLSEKLSFICPDNLNTFFMHQCRHGLGHGLMAWSSYDLPATLDYCELIEDPSGKASCRTGAFMENIVGSLTESPEARARGHFTKYLSDDPQFPCNVVKDAYKGECYFLQTDRMWTLSTTPNKFQGVVDECLKPAEHLQHYCFLSMGRTVGGINRGRPEQAIRDCQLIPDQAHRIDCIVSVAKDYLWDPSGQEGGLRFCSLVPAEDGQIPCYQGLTEHARAVLNTEQLSSFCTRIPPELQNECLTPAT
ncbi:MAG: hypothetical protein KBA40_03770 [Candidatus Peribacteraceae bacterium]|nr:hypothetical protein [Candidatus Peribacteraceae bacterium]MBP9850900.1 hypothetical protein [Candidatus Peribacteraceae bacterium]